MAAVVLRRESARLAAASFPYWATIPAASAGPQVQKHGAKSLMTAAIMESQWLTSMSVATARPMREKGAPCGECM